VASFSTLPRLAPTAKDLQLVQVKRSAQVPELQGLVQGAAQQRAESQKVRRPLKVLQLTSGLGIVGIRQGLPSGSYSFEHVTNKFDTTSLIRVLSDALLQRV
jgi:hypothetical protein